jgi:putative phage-type endonuclease
MKILENIIQGSSEWLEIRKSHFTASEAPAALGKSKYTSRTELLNQKASGISKDVDSFTQALFDKGHEAEAKARVIAEKIIGSDLYPVTSTLELNGMSLLASFDGCTIDESVIWEHKLFNESLANDIRNGTLNAHYTIQLDQQLLISGASKCLFMTSDGTEENMAWCWYESSQDKFDALILGWAQFKWDLESHVVAEEVIAVVAAPTMDLPALSIQVEGAIKLISNLDTFGTRLKQFVNDIDKSPSDDQGFVDAEAAIKTLSKAETALEAAESNALAQTASVDEMRKTVALYKEIARTTRLMLEKMVESR